MRFGSFAQLDKELDRLLAAGEEARGLELLDWAIEGLPENWADVLISRAYFYCRLGRAHEALEDIRTLVDLGGSCPLHWAIFKVMEPLPGYEEVKQANEVRLAEQRADARMAYRVFKPEGVEAGEPCPLVLALHGDGSFANLEQFPQVWPAEPLTRKGIAVAYVQSSQLMFIHNHEWLPNPEIARRDILEAYGAICTEMSIDPDRVALAGFSGGATTAIFMAFSEAFGVCGFVALCPANLLPTGVNTESVGRAAQRSVAGVILEGELAAPVEAHETMLEMFQTAGMRYRYVINPGIGHALPDDLGAKLAEAIDFILET